MYQIKQSEATAARRRIPVLLVDLTDGFTPETGVVTPTIVISKLGAAIATGAGTWTEIGNGQYYYEFTAGEVDTLGWIAVNIEKATVSRDYNAIVQVMAYDYAVATNLGLTAIPAVATGSAGAIPTTGSGANQITVNGSGAISTVVSVSGSVGSVTGAVGSVTGNVSGSVASVVGAVGSVTGNVSGNVTGSVGSLTATAVSNIWSALTSGLTTVSSVGKLIVDRLDTNVGSRMATFTLPTNFSTLAIDASGFVTFNNVISLPTVGSIATAVWSEPIPGSFAAGTAGAKLNSAGSSADPWSTALPGSYAAGTAGNIVGNRLDAAITSRMATFTLPTNFSALAITVGGAITAGTVSDKTGYSLSTSQTFNTTGSVGSVTGSVASVSGNIGGNVIGSVNSVVGNVGGNVVGSVNSVVGSVGSVTDVSTIWNYLTANILTTNSIGLLLKTNVDAQISTRLASSSYTVSPTVAQIWQASLPGSFTLGQAGYIVGTNLNDTITSRMATFTYTVPPTTTAIMSAIWNQVRATANGGITPVSGTFGYFLDSRVSTAGGGGGGIIVKQGPFKVTATDLGSNNILDLVKGDNRNIQISVVDEYGENLPLNAAYTHNVKIYNSASVLVSTYAATLDYATGGLVSFNIDTTTTNTTGNYNAVLVINDGTSDTIYGGLEIQVRL